MTRTDKEFDDYGKRTMNALRLAPAMDPQVAAETRKRYFLQAENLRQGLISQPGEVEKGKFASQFKRFGAFQRLPVMKTLAALLLAMLIIVTGGSISVYAAQSSLPGEPLYSIKSLSEDVRLSMTFSTKAKLNLTLDYTNRRANEISDLLAGGQTVNDHASDRYQRELDSALQYAALLDDSQIGNALGQIKTHAENQGMAMEELLNQLHPQAEPAVVHLQARLAEQVRLSQFGELDPQAFRVQIHDRLQKQQENKHSTGTGQPESSSPDLTITPEPGLNDNEHGNKTNRPTDVPGNDNPGNGKGQSTPEIGNHDLNGKKTQEP
jgi:Domain of unknown function (DUF5667)